MTHRPNSEAVAVAWAKGVPGLLAVAGVATKRPANPLEWSPEVDRVHRFIRVGPVLGGGLSDVPLRQPVINLTLYGARIGSSQPPHWAVEELAELILADTWTDENGRTDAGHREVTQYLPTNYAPAAVRVVKAMHEARRQPGDAASYSKYTMDLQIFWVSG